MIGKGDWMLVKKDQNNMLSLVGCHVTNKIDFDNGMCNEISL